MFEPVDSDSGMADQERTYLAIAVRDHSAAYSCLLVRGQVAHFQVLGHPGMAPPRTPGGSPMILSQN